MSTDRQTQLSSNPLTKKCAICGGDVPMGEGWSIAGVFGKGWRHKDAAVCMERLKDAPDD